MFYAGHTIPTTAAALAVDVRYLDPNWTDEAGFTLRQLAVAAHAERDGSWDQARDDVADLWNRAARVTARTVDLAEVA